MLPSLRQVISLGRERFRCAELLFQPSMAGLDSPGLPQTAYDSMDACAMDLRRTFYANILLSGEPPGCSAGAVCRVSQGGARLGGWVAECGGLCTYPACAWLALALTTLIWRPCGRSRLAQGSFIVS
jgi:hypothetical protein